MRKLDLTDYQVSVRDQDQKRRSIPYFVRDSLVELCFLPAEGCKKLELLKRNKIAQKIADAPGESVLLEDAEWQRLSDALDQLPGFGHNEVELVRRIVEAPTVLTEEKREPPPV